ncbi:MAG TPA: triose-phosphate isomerase, partial [Gemmataceae bacterium]
MARKKLIAGNWKMYTLRAPAQELAKAVADGLGPAPPVEVAVCPPFPWLLSVAEVLKGTPVALGAQNVHPQPEGAYTGEVSAPMLVDAGCRYVIVGHSERRHGLGEGDGFLNEKAKAALRAGLSVIFCVGETLEERQRNDTEAVLERQLRQGLYGLPEEHLDRLVIAYEPV